MTFSKKIIFPVFTFFLFVLILFSGCTQNTSSDTKKLHCIYIVHAPNKTEYTADDIDARFYIGTDNKLHGYVPFDVTELKLKAHYTDGTTEDVTDFYYYPKDLDFSFYNKNSITSQKVEIRALIDGKTVSTYLGVNVNSCPEKATVTRNFDVSKYETAAKSSNISNYIIDNCPYTIHFVSSYISNYRPRFTDWTCTYDNDNLSSLKISLPCGFVIDSYDFGSGGSGTTNCSHPSCSISTTTPPTCIKSGSITYICDTCGTVITQTPSALGYCESPIDATTYSPATKDSTYVYFGVFPQTVLASESSITIDENNSVTIGGITYYKGDDGEYYAKVTAAPAGSGYLYSDYTEVKKENRYFKMEPVKWRVLDTGFDIDGDSGSETGVLLVADEILTSNVPFFENININRTVDADTEIHPSNYKYSQIRAYLNGIYYYGDDNSQKSDYLNAGFLQTAFTSDAQKVIKTTTVDNSASTTNSSNNTYVCENTTDKIFLLSYSEACNNAYGSMADNTARVRIPTDYALANKACKSSTVGYGGNWWLRSPYNVENQVSCINDDGDKTYFYANKVGLGIVPALCVSF